MICWMTGEHALLSEPLLSVVRVAVQQVLNIDSDIVGELDVQKPAQCLVFSPEGIKVWWRASCKMQRVGSFYPFSSMRITNSLENMFKDLSLYEMGKVLPLQKWSKKFRGSFFTQ